MASREEALLHLGVVDAGEAGGSQHRIQLTSHSILINSLQCQVYFKTAHLALLLILLKEDPVQLVWSRWADFVAPAAMLHVEAKATQCQDDDQQTTETNRYWNSCNALTLLC